MTDVLDQLEALGAARRELVQTPRALVLAVDMLRPHYTLGDELQSSSAPVAAQALAHATPIRGRRANALAPPVPADRYIDVVLVVERASRLALASVTLHILSTFLAIAG
jgi:hypothetical protein